MAERSLLRFKINTRSIYIFSLITGVVSGLVALAFSEAVHYVAHFLQQNVTHIPGTLPKNLSIKSLFTLDYNRLLVLIVPSLGGLLVGIIAKWTFPASLGSGTEVFLDAFHNQNGNLPKRTGPIKLLSSVLTLGTGGAGGKEGPMALIGSSVGSIVGRLFSMGARAKRTLLLAGAAGGLGAIFRTPLGGAITAVEVLYKEDFESDALIPCVLSSVTAYTTFGSFAGFGHILHFKSTGFHSPKELIFYVVLALFCTVSAFIFVSIYKTSHSLFAKLNLSPVLKPALGGLLLGVLGLITPYALGGGTDLIQHAINGLFNRSGWQDACLIFLFLAFLKMFATSLTIQSGGSAGALIPCFFIGAMLGGFCGTVFQKFSPETVPSITPFIVVGMASFFAAATNASLGALVMVTELTGGYELLPPLMIVAVISLIFSHKWSIYTSQVTNKFFSKAHLWDMNPSILKNINISSAFDKFQDIAIISSQDDYATIRRKARQIHDSEFVVKDPQGALLGLVTLHDLDFDEDEDLSGLDNLLVAGDMLHGVATWVTPEDTLFKVLQRLSVSDVGKIPVVIHNKPGAELLGYLTRKDVLKFYNGLGG